MLFCDFSYTRSRARKWSCIIIDFESNGFTSLVILVPGPVNGAALLLISKVMALQL